MIWLAPMHGITYHNFRNCLVKHFKGIDCAITPFIAAQSKDKLNPKKLHDLFPENNRALAIIPQFMGNKPCDIKDTAIVLNETFGYKQFNWNIGCPVNQIVRKKRGCGVMPFVELIEDTVNEVCGKTSLRLSLKMRLGLHAQDEGLEILQRLAPYPIDFLCIHPRLGVQQYEGNVDLNTFELFYKITNHKIVYSGDINEVDFFTHLQKRFPKIENWMLGRGILKNPFLAEETTKGGMRYAVCDTQKIENSKTLSIPINLSSRFIDFYNEYAHLLLSLKNEKIALSSLKELWHYFAFFWKLEVTELKKILIINDYQQFSNAINLLFSQRNF